MDRQRQEQRHARRHESGGGYPDEEELIGGVVVAALMDRLPHDQNGLLDRIDKEVGLVAIGNS